MRRHLVPLISMATLNAGANFVVDADLLSLVGISSIAGVEAADANPEPRPLGAETVGIPRCPKHGLVSKNHQSCCAGEAKAEPCPMMGAEAVGIPRCPTHGLFSEEPGVYSSNAFGEVHGLNAESKMGGLVVLVRARRARVLVVFEEDCAVAWRSSCC